LNKRLENGDVVEILTNPHRTPERDWLKFIVTARAKQQVKTWVRQEQRVRSTGLGRDLLMHELTRFEVDPGPYMEDEPMKEAARALEMENNEDLLAAIGFGRVSAREVVDLLVPERAIQAYERREKSAIRRLVRRVGGKSRHSVEVKGRGDLLIRFAKCCDPIPGDSIVGFITRGKGVTVHSQKCSGVHDLLDDKDRLVEVSWGDLKKDKLHDVTLTVEAVDRPGILAGLSAAIADCQSNIARVEAESHHDRAGIRLQVQVRNLEHLNEVLKRAKEVKGVLSVLRVSPQGKKKGVLDGLI
jgi:GTP pyrophosphokinase